MKPPPARILCTEDVADTRNLLLYELTHAGFEVMCVENSEQALSFARMELFDLYLIDSWLPGMSGDALCRNILPRICDWFFRKEIAVIDHDGNLSEQHEFSQWDSHRRQWSTCTWHRSRHFALREYEPAARFVRDDCAHVLVLDGCAPTEAATV
jgi:hypothetical protein